MAAAFTPFYWATNAMIEVSQAPQITLGLALRAAGEVGVTFLWALVIAIIAVAIGRVRLRERGA